MKRVGRFHRNSGISLVELLIVMTIMSLGGVGIFTLTRGLLAKQHATCYARLLRDAINFARFGALVTGQRVVLCHDRSSTLCRSVNYPCPMVLTEKGEILRLLPCLPSGDLLHFKISGAKPSSSVRFNPDGLLDGHSGSFSYCPRQGSSYARAIIFNRSGRVRISPVDARGGHIGCGGHR